MRAKKRENGFVTLEFALLATLVLLPLLMGALDVNQMITASNGVERAAREGALAASRGIAPDSIALAALGGYGLDQGRASVTLIPGADYPNPGSRVTVRVNYDLAGATILPLNVMFPDGVGAEAVMRHE